MCPYNLSVFVCSHFPGGWVGIHGNLRNPMAGGWWQSRGWGEEVQPPHHRPFPSIQRLRFFRSKSRCIRNLFLLNQSVCGGGKTHRPVCGGARGEDEWWPMGRPPKSSPAHFLGSAGGDLWEGCLCCGTCLGSYFPRPRAPGFDVRGRHTLRWGTSHPQPLLDRGAPQARHPIIWATQVKSKKKEKEKNRKKNPKIKHPDRGTADGENF